MIIGISGRIGSGKDTVGKIIQYLVARKGDERGSKVQTMEFLGLTDSNWNSIYRSQDWKIKKFAGKLKQIVSILTGIPVEDLEKQEVKDRVLGEEWSYIVNLKGKRVKEAYSKDIAQINTKYTVRQLLQEVGTEAMRDVIHPNIWVNALFADYKKYFTSGDFVKSDGTSMELKYPNWIITDMRFPNELQAVKDRGGITIRVNRLKNIDRLPFPSLVKEFAEYANVDTQEHSSETALDNAEFDYVIENNGTIEELIKKVRQILNKEKII